MYWTMFRSGIAVVGAGAVESDLDDRGVVGHVGAGVGHRSRLDDRLFQRQDGPGA